MSEDYSAAAERIVNATNLADDDLSSFEDDVRTVALGYLDQAARIAELEAALAFYANIREYNPVGGDPPGSLPPIVTGDRGARARAALALDADA